MRRRPLQIYANPCTYADPYVKLWLFQGSTKLETRKTTVKQQCLAPIYNESFAFNVPPKDKLEVEVNFLVTVSWVTVGLR